MIFKALDCEKLLPSFSHGLGLQRVMTFMHFMHSLVQDIKPCLMNILGLENASFYMVDSVTLQTAYSVSVF